MASREFEQEFKKIISKGHPKVCERLLFLLRSWAEGDFKSDPQLNLIPSLYIKLRQDGMEFPSPESSKVYCLFSFIIFLNFYNYYFYNLFYFTADAKT